MTSINELAKQTTVSSQIPVIDIYPFITGDTNTREAVANQISDAIQEVGCFYLKNGVSQTLIDQAFAQAESFFTLPLEEKQQVASEVTGRSRGYIPFEKMFIGNQPGQLHESFSFGKELDPNKAGIDSYAEALDVPNQWPQNPPEFRELMEQFFTASQESALNVLEALAIALQLPTSYFTNLHSQQNHAGVFNYYPYISQAPKTGQTRFFEHTDLGSITLLFQDQGGGLEVYTPKGEWITTTSVPETVLVMPADMMSRWTNDQFCAAPHRVSVPDDFQSIKQRYSFSFFVIPDYDVEVNCLETCLKAEASPKYPPTFVGDHLLKRTNDRATKYGRS
ncbi:isopenicillin N synthase family dioxygenase [Nodularia sphaerocarpa]|uniref:isopenicillin N synthase family dioxygenase n=1 Tax=Nodularia sphaerocarpa TaxID=137816 RepID=UPI001EFBCF77|nr:2-oxoglutarate and iron-dependent oxygenase domain-containing protein [Nodularia sphaerocarpa]MDB9373575.1 2-oxoglutarate and iron-dependent oxygenase domain-containing protein [Nodularia sphaerocarpa CS-585]ULP74363.1 isopenicillin N synthase [Nodularia sphaerocarpa UHCC 0038]